MEHASHAALSLCHRCVSPSHLTLRACCEVPLAPDCHAIVILTEPSAGGTNQAFEQLHSLQQVRGVLAGIDRSPGIALMCLNDDLTRDFDAVTQYLYRWFEKKWGEPAAWEVDLYHRDGSDRPRRTLERDTLAIGS